VVSLLGYAAQGLSLVAIPLFLKEVGADGYGLMVTVMAFTGYLGFADAGLSWGSMILIAHANGRGSQEEIAHVVRHSMVLAACSGGIVALALGLTLFTAKAGWRLPMFSGHPESDLLILIAGSQLALALQFSVFYNLFQGLQEGYWTAFYQGLGRMLGLLATMLAAWLTRSVANMMLAQLAFTVVGGAAAALHAWRAHPWAFANGSWSDRAQYETQLRTSGKSLMLQVGRTMSGTAPTLALSSVLGPGSVPFYTVPTTLLSMFFSPINAWNANMQSAYGEAWHSGAKGWVKGAFRLSLERAIVVSGLGLALFWALGGTFIRVWTHERLRLEPAMASSVSVIAITAAFLTAGQYLLTGLNRHRRAAAAEVGNGVLALLLVTLALRWIGVAGLGLGVVVAAATTSGWVLRREIASYLGHGCFPTAWFILRVCLSAAGAAGASLATMALFGRNASSLSAVPSLIAAGLFGTAVFLVAVLAFRLAGAEEALAMVRRLRAAMGGPAAVHD
jgi:O-antigen/teichoic acid export membrane protein